MVFKTLLFVCDVKTFFNGLIVQNVLDEIK